MPFYQTSKTFQISGNKNPFLQWSFLLLLIFVIASLLYPPKFANALPAGQSSQQTGEFPGGLDIVFIIDQSGSMSGTGGAKGSPNDPSQIRMEGIKVVNNYLQFVFETTRNLRQSNLGQIPDFINRVGVVSFGSNAQVDAPLTQINFDDKAKLDQFNTKFNPTSLGNTNFTAAFSSAAKMLNEADNPTPNLNRLKVIFLVTDGAPYLNDGSPGEIFSVFDDTEQIINQLRAKFGSSFDLWVTGLDANPSGSFWENASKGRDGKHFWKKVAPNQAELVTPDQFGERYLEIISAIVKRVGPLPIPDRIKDPREIEVPPYLQQVKFVVVQKPISGVRLGPLFDPAGNEVKDDPQKGIRIEKTQNENFVTYEITRQPDQPGVPSGKWGFRTLDPAKLEAADVVFVTRGGSRLLKSSIPPDTRFKQFSTTQVNFLLYDEDKPDGQRGDLLLSDKNYPLTLEMDLKQGSLPNRTLKFNDKAQPGQFVSDDQINFEQNDGYTLISSKAKVYYTYQGQQIEIPIVSGDINLPVEGLKVTSVTPNLAVDQFSDLNYEFKIAFSDGKPSERPLNPGDSNTKFELTFSAIDGWKQEFSNDKIKFDSATNTYRVDSFPVSTPLALSPILTVTTQAGSYNIAIVSNAKLPGVSVKPSHIEAVKPAPNTELAQDSTVEYDFKLVDATGNQLDARKLPDPASSQFSFELALNGPASTPISLTNSDLTLDRSSGIYSFKPVQLSAAGQYGAALAINLPGLKDVSGKVANLVNFDQFPSVKVYKVTRLTISQCFIGTAADLTSACLTDKNKTELIVSQAKPWLGLSLITGQEPDKLRAIFKLTDENGNPVNPATVTSNGLAMEKLLKTTLKLPDGKTVDQAFSPVPGSTSPGQGLVVIDLKQASPDLEAGEYLFSATTNEPLKREFCYARSVGDKCDPNFQPQAQPLQFSRAFSVKQDNTLQIINQGIAAVLILVLAVLIGLFVYYRLTGHFGGTLEVYDPNNPSMTKRIPLTQKRRVQVIPGEMISYFVATEIKRLKITKVTSDDASSPPAINVVKVEVEGGANPPEELEARPGGRGIPLARGHFMRYLATGGTATGTRKNGAGLPPRPRP